MKTIRCLDNFNSICDILYIDNIGKFTRRIYEKNYFEFSFVYMAPLIFKNEKHKASCHPNILA